MQCIHTHMLAAICGGRKEGALFNLVVLTDHFMAGGAAGPGWGWVPSVGLFHQNHTVLYEYSEKHRILSQREGQKENRNIK